MSAVIKAVKTVRNHWKKSLAFALISAYGVKYGKNKYEEDLLRRQYCAEAQAYGDQYVDIYQKPRRITVFLNPAAYDGKARSLFEKNAAPLLHLAGLEVNVVKTEYDGHIKDFMTVLEAQHVDGLVVAGGNGSVLETVTALMRKEDKTFRQKVPLGIIPVGETNKFAAYFHGKECTDIKCMLEAAMAVVRGVHEKVDVVKIQAEDGRSTFALCGMEAGAYRDAKERTKKYWYFGPLKHRFTYIRSALSSWPPLLKGSVEYVVATDSNNRPKPAAQSQQSQPVQTWTWKSLLFGFLTPQKRPGGKKEEEEEEEEDIDDTEKVTRELKAVELTMNSRFTTAKEEKKLSGIEVGFGPEEIPRTTFIQEGWRRLSCQPWEIGSGNNEKLLVKKIKFIPEVKEGSSVWFNIDGEHFEAMPVEVSLLKSRLRIFSNTQNVQPR